MPNHSNKQQTESLSGVNFSASHDQAYLLDEMSTKYTELRKIPNDLEEIKLSLQRISPEVKTRVEQQALSNKIEEKQTVAIKLVEYAQQVVKNLHKTAKKLNAIHQKSPEEKLKTAQLLLTADKPLNTEEQYRFKKIEQALGNTCIIKSAGDETIKFQLGVLGNAREHNFLSQPEFNYLVIVRLQENNLLDDYRLRIEGDMIFERTYLWICQAIDEELFSDLDYQDSKALFAKRLKGIACELSLQKLSDNRSAKQGLSSLQNELMSSLAEAASNTEEGLEEEALHFPEVVTTPLEEVNLNQTLCAVALKIENFEKDQKKSDFVELMEELIPKNKRKKIQIDDVKPISIEKIMKITLERPSPLSEDEIRKLNHSYIMIAAETTNKALNKIQEDIKHPLYSSIGDNVCKEMMMKLTKHRDEHAEKIQEPKPCKLAGEDLVKEYYKFVQDYLANKKQKIEAQISDLVYSKQKRYAEFSKHKLVAKHGNLSSHEKKEIRKKTFQEKKEKLNEQLEKINKQAALWERSETFIQSVYDAKTGRIRQEKIAFSTEEINFRDLALKYNPNYEAQQQKVNVYRDGVYLVAIKKTKSASVGLEKSNTHTNDSGSGLSASRVSYKEQFSALSSSSLFSINSESNGLNQEQKKLAAVDVSV